MRMLDENELTVASRMAGRLTGRNSPEDEVALEAWLQESEEHRRFYERVTDGAYLSVRLQAYEACSLEELRGRLMAAVGREARRRRFVRRIRSVAAVATVLLVVGSLLLWQTGRVEPMAVQEVVPGRQCAVLETADGRQMELTPGADLGGMVADGVVVANGQDGLSYRATDAEAAGMPEYNMVTVPKGGEYQLTLADGSRVWLNAASRLRYPVRFTGGKREVFLEGEAYFEVSRSEAPFEVHGGGQCVRVLGTEFNVMAYGNEGRVQTTLVNGKVQVAADDGRGGKPVVLLPGEQAELDKAKGTYTTRRVDVADYCGWRERLFVFGEEDLATMMRKLARWYDVEVEIESPGLQRIEFYGVIGRYEHISTILDMLKKMRKLDYRMEGRKVIIKEIR